MKRPVALWFCIFMDLMGYASYALPVLGELSDLVWAPVSAIIFYISFGGWKGAFGGLFNFAEELLPGLDFIPTFTLTWFWQRYGAKNRSMSLTKI